MILIFGMLCYMRWFPRNVNFRKNRIKKKKTRLHEHEWGQNVFSIRSHIVHDFTIQFIFSWAFDFWMALVAMIPWMNVLLFLLPKWFIPWYMKWILNSLCEEKNGIKWKQSHSKWRKTQKFSMNALITSCTSCIPIPLRSSAILWIWVYRCVGCQRDDCPFWMKR